MNTASVTMYCIATASMTVYFIPPASVNLHCITPASVTMYCITTTSVTVCSHPQNARTLVQVECGTWHCAALVLVPPCRDGGYVRHKNNRTNSILSTSRYPLLYHIKASWVYAGEVCA